MKRINKLLELISDDVDAVIISKHENIRYLTGYMGEGLLYVSQKRSIILTDFRYVEMANNQAPQFEVIETSKDNPTIDVIYALIKEECINKLGFEDDHFTVRILNSYKEKLSDIEFLPFSGQTEQLREIKDEYEIESIAQAVNLGDQAFSHILNILRVGISELDIAIEIEYFMRKNGAEDKAFDSIVASGSNSSMPHAMPGKRVLQKGDLLTLDFGCKINGYCSDMTRTVAIGSLGDELKSIYNTVLSAQLLALEALNKSGDRVGKEIDAVARNYIEERYPGRFGHGLGHGVGLLIHEAPGLTKNNENPLPVHAVITVEPGIYLPEKGGVRIEDTVLITESGVRIFTYSDKSLIII